MISRLLRSVYLDGIYSVADVLAIPKLMVMDIRQAVARFLLDHTEIGKAVVVEHNMRERQEVGRGRLLHLPRV